MSSDVPERILIIRPSALGDVAKTIAVLASLRRAYPDARIDWLVNEGFRDVIAHHPANPGVIEFPRKRFAKFGRSISVTRQFFRYCATLRREQYSRVYDLQGLMRSGFLTSVTGAKRRVGFADARELSWLGCNVRHHVDAGPQTIDRMLGLIEADGVPAQADMRLYVGETDRHWWQAEMERHDVEAGRYLLIAPTTKWLSKRWPIERFAEVARSLCPSRFSAVVVVGGPNEHDQVGAWLNDADGEPMPIVNMVGRTRVGQMMAIIDQAGLLISNDSAALHFAVGLSTRVVGLYGATDPAKVGPYRYDDAVVEPMTQDPAERARQMARYREKDLDDRWMRMITVEQVLERIERIMQLPPPQTVYADAKDDADG